MLNSLAHNTARLCVTTVPAALLHLSSTAGMARWNLGLWNCREMEPGLFTGESLFDGAPGWVRVQVDAQRGLVDYLVGPNPQALSPRIRASVKAGELLGYASGSCVITLEAWRCAGMSDERWLRLTQTHETEIDLICAQLGSAAASSALAGAAVEPAHVAAARRHISSGSPWEELAGYSRAVVDGAWVFVSGTIGQDFATLSMPDSAAAQTDQALDTIERALAQAGASLQDVVRVRVYVPLREDVPAISAVLKQRLGAARPANTTICCPLPVAGAKVEVDVTARRAIPL